MKPKIQPLDVVVVDGLWYMPHHWLIQWRGLDKGVHCLTVCSENGDGISPEFSGLKVRNLDEYRGRRVTIHRLKEPCNVNHLHRWLMDIYNSAHGYDFRQWLLGFVLGIVKRSWVDGSGHWTCAELPYWLYQDNGHPVTPLPELLPMPRLFRYNPAFNVIFDGVWE